MKNIAIICEYNPFHNGHKYQIDKIRQNFDEKINIICIMSGNFVQRGDFAIFDKHTRAKMAILGGADLIIELPLPFAISSADFFAKGSILLLNALNSIDYLCFGSECGDTSMLFDISKTILDENFINLVKLKLKDGISYPKALEFCLNEINPNFGEIIKNPNNILGVEYIKALISQNSSIKPMTILRKNVDHHSLQTVSGFASATFIRQNISNDILNLIPENSAKIIENLSSNNILTVENSILSYLKRKNSDYFLKINDVSEGLEYKIVKELKSATSLNDLYEKIKSKRYTQSRIRRIILNSYLEITKDFLKISPQYAKILAFNQNGRKIIKEMKINSKIPLIIKPNANYNLNDDGMRLFDLDCVTTDLYSMCFNDENKRISGYELTKSPIYIENF